MLVTAIHKRHNISSLEQGTTRHTLLNDMRYSISISQPPPAMIITHYRMFLVEVQTSMHLIEVFSRAG